MFSCGYQFCDMRYYKGKGLQQNTVRTCQVCRIVFVLLIWARGRIARVDTVRSRGSYKWSLFVFARECVERAKSWSNRPAFSAFASDCDARLCSLAATGINSCFRLFMLNDRGLVGCWSCGRRAARNIYKAGLLCQRQLTIGIGFTRVRKTIAAFDRDCSAAGVWRVSIFVHRRKKVSQR